MTENLDEDNKPLMKLLFPEEEKENNSSENKEDILFKIGNINIDMEKKRKVIPKKKKNQKTNRKKNKLNHKKK